VNVNADTTWFDNITGVTSEWLRKEFDLYKEQEDIDHTLLNHI
jgi:hypothetical protein